MSPYEVRIFPHRRMIRVTARGPASFREAEESVRELTSDPRFEDDYSLLVDLREIDYLPSSTEARAFADLLGAFGGRIALVASQGVAYGLARMVSLFAQAQGLPVEAFGDLAAAEAWLEQMPRKPPP